MKRRIAEWENRSGKRDAKEAGLPEEDVERHTSLDKRARSSNEPVLPIAGGNEDGHDNGDDEEDGSPGIEEEEPSDAETTEYPEGGEEDEGYDTAESQFSRVQVPGRT